MEMQRHGTTTPCPARAQPVQIDEQSDNISEYDRAADKRI